VQPFKKGERVLLVGEGEFPVVPVLQPYVTPSLLCCTAYDTGAVASQKYPDLATHITALRDAGATVLFGVDGTNLAQSKEDRSIGFDKIVFNFPHVGQGITDQARNIRANQTLLLDFYRSAAPLLRTGKARALGSSAKSNKGDSKSGSEDDDDDDEEEDLAAAAQEAQDISDLGLLGDNSMQAGISAPAAPPPSANRGTVLLTLRTNGPYTSWLPSQLATKPSLLLPSLYPPHELKLRSTPQRGGEQPRYRTVRSWKFEMRKWEEEGYEHRRTIGYEEKYAELGGEQQQHDIRTWEFELVTPED
ncbi:hypothetical protein RHOSPDRAFT_4026, partial [Rhodotorula sp. JG-1b]